MDVCPGPEDHVHRLEPLLEHPAVVVEAGGRAPGCGVNDFEQLRALGRAEVEAQVELDVERGVPREQLALVLLTKLGELTEKEAQAKAFCYD